MKTVARIGIGNTWWKRFKYWVLPKLGYCPIHGKRMYKYRKNTSYENEKDNWSRGCIECETASFEYYESLAKEMYSAYE